MDKPHNDDRYRSMPIMAWPSFATGPSLDVMQPSVASMTEFDSTTILGWIARDGSK